MGLGLRPGAKAPDQPPMPYRLRASPRLYRPVRGALGRHGGPHRLALRGPGPGGAGRHAGRACDSGRRARAPLRLRPARRSDPRLGPGAPDGGSLVSHPPGTVHGHLSARPAAGVPAGQRDAAIEAPVDTAGARRFRSSSQQSVHQTRRDDGERPAPHGRRRSCQRHGSPRRATGANVRHRRGRRAFTPAAPVTPGPEEGLET